MNRTLENKVVVITGAGRGIGRATALAFAEAGAAVVLAARSAPEINSVAAEIKHQGGNALAIPTDVSDISSVDHLLVLALRACRRIDILINNAALIQPLGKVWETAPTRWRKLIAVNVVGPYLCARAFLPHMIDRGSGHIINVSSGAAVKPIEGASAYTTSKAALEQFSATLAAELSETGVAVTTFRPGAVDTDMQKAIRETPTHHFPRAAYWQSRYENSELHTPAEIAQALIWTAIHARQNGLLVDINDEKFQQRIAAELTPG